MSSSSPEDGTELTELCHEVGNALSAASAHTQFLLRRLPAWADTRDQQALRAIQDGLLRANRLLRPAPLGFPTTRCDLQTLMALATSQVPPERAPDLVVNVRAEIPMIVSGHPERIVQVLANLLDNAVKYSQPGTPIEVETYWIHDVTGDWALIVVRDEGIGIDTPATETIFAGYRTEAARQTAPGSGVGLQLGRRLIEAEGGQLWAIGAPGSGSSFHMKLPLAPLDAAEPAREDLLGGLVSALEDGDGVTSATTGTQDMADGRLVAGAPGVDVGARR
jgi:signal transduction histidine kinase